MNTANNSAHAWLRLAALLSFLAGAIVVLLGVRLVTADNSITAPDTIGTVGLYPSMVLDASGNPVIAYFRSDTGDLKVMHCNDPNCAGGGDTRTAVDTGGTVGINPSLALDHQGYPVVSYHDDTLGDLKVLRCNDPNCAGSNESIESPVTLGDVGFYSSLFIDNIHHPKIAFIDTDTDQLKLLSCNDDNCAGGNETVTLVGTEAQFVSMVPDSSGFPVIATRNTNMIYDGLWLIHCDDFNCTTWSNEAPHPFGTALFPSLQLDSFGYPVVSYKSNTGANLTVLHCNDPDCDGAAENINTPVDTGATGAFSSLELDAAGNPVVSYYNESNDTLDVVHCNDPNCAGSGDSVTTPDADTDDIGWYTSLELDAAGNPVVAYYNAITGNLKLLHCDNPDCDPPATATPTVSVTTSPSPSPTASPTPSTTASGSVTPTPTPSPTPTGPTPSPSPSPTPIGQTPSPTPIGQTATPTPIETPTPTRTGVSPTPTPTATPIGQTPTPTPTPASTPVPSGSATPTATPRPSGTWGDIDCNQSVDPIDALKGLRYDAGLNISQSGDCPNPGQPDPLFGGERLGDWDCNDSVNPVDALKDLRYDAGLEVSQNPPCPSIGEFRIWRP